MELRTREGKQKEALAPVRNFHRTACDEKVLDSACGSGSFLYVALELMKRLDGEVMALMAELERSRPASLSPTTPSTRTSSAQVTESVSWSACTGAS